MAIAHEPRRQLTLRFGLERIELRRRGTVQHFHQRDCAGLSVHAPQPLAAQARHRGAPALVQRVYATR
jgi:hypothetical protein